MVGGATGRILSVARTTARRVRGVARRQFITRNRRLAGLLAVAVVLIGVAAAEETGDWFSPGVMILPILAGGLLLWPRALRILFCLVAVMLAYDGWVDKDVGPGIAATIVVTALFADVLARTRAKLGMQGLRGDQMLIELRDRLRVQSRLPALPDGWHSVSVLKPAGGASFGGDFLVSACDGKTLEVALVDVSGKGIDAGTRALLLSGAFGGLLGSVPPADFLAACNAYLRRSTPAEGFVTAVHIAVDLATGEYVIVLGRPPPAAHFEAGSGRWRLTEARGIVLGVVPDLREPPGARRAAPGRRADALHRRAGRGAGHGTSTPGIDRLLGEADRLVAERVRSRGGPLVQTMQGGRATSDDCALVLIWRA